MVKKLKVISESNVVEAIIGTVIPQRLDLITQEFSNGDMNVLRDKINEIIKRQ